MIVINDLQGDDWTGWTFKSKKDLKNFLQGESAVTSGFDTIEEYYLTYKASKGLDWFVEGLVPTDLEEISKQ